MSTGNDYSAYTKEELASKVNRFKKLQIAMTILAIVVSSAIAIVSYIKNAPEGYKMVPILLVVGIAYPFLAFSGERKKMQTELENRSNS